MADEDARPGRGRKKSAGKKSKAAKPKPATAPKAKAGKADRKAKPAAATVKSAPKRTARRTAAAPTPEAIAERAYLLWEQGEPGDEKVHWLRAEAELRA